MRFKTLDDNLVHEFFVRLRRRHPNVEQHQLDWTHRSYQLAAEEPITCVACMVNESR